MNNKEIRRKNLKHLIKNKCDDDIVSFSKKIGTAESAIRRFFYEGKNSRNIGDITAKKIEDKFNLVNGWMDKAQWLATGKGDMTSNVEHVEVKTKDIILWDDVSDLPADEFVFVPYLQVNASCGDGYINDDYTETTKKLAFRTDFIKSSKAISTNLKTLKAKGNSMNPTIFDGDALLIDLEQNTIKNGNVYAFTIDDKLIVKRLSIDNEQIKAHSDNQSDSRYRYDESYNEKQDKIKIIGRIVHRGGSGGL